MTIQEIVPVLQIAIGPAILISGVGLLLLTMTNRIGRVIDRARVLVQVRRAFDGGHQPQVEAQIDILWRRAGLLRRAIILAVVAALLAAVLVIALFAGVVMRWEIARIIVMLFVACLVAVILSLVNLIADINLTLHALRLELDMPN